MYSFSTAFIQLLLFTSLHYGATNAAQLTTESAKMTQWPGSVNYPTWYFNTDLKENPLSSWNELGAIANAHWNWVVNQDKARSLSSGTKGTVLVTSLWDPVTKVVYSSTVPRNPRKFQMLNGGKAGKAPAWWDKVKAMPMTGDLSKFPPDYHAEDACYYNYETGLAEKITTGKYSTGEFNGGMWIVTYGAFGLESGTVDITSTTGNFVAACGQNQNNKSPTCMEVAAALGVWVTDKTVPATQLDQADETDSDEYGAGTIDWDEVMEGCFDTEAPNTKRGNQYLRGHSKARRNATVSSVACPASSPAPTASPAESISLDYLTQFTKTASTDAPPTSLPLGITASASSSTAPAVTEFSCSMQEPDPDGGLVSALCVCKDSSSAISAPLMSIASSALTIYSQSCEYSTWPATTTSESVALPAPTTNIKMCEVCTRVNVNGDVCNTIPGCTKQVAVASLTVGSKPVHVGTLTGTDLYTSVSHAIASLCPTPSQTQSSTQCDETGSVSIDGIEYVSEDSLETGSLEVQIPTSGYNDSTILQAMINSIATSVKNSAGSANNCFTVDYTVEELKRRGLTFRDVYESTLNFAGLGGLVQRDHPYPVQEHKTMCNAAWFHTVEYYGEFWRSAAEPGATDYLNAEVTFHTSNSDNFLCEFLDDLVDALIIIEPEFAVGDVELEESINAICCLEDGSCSG
ncbi:hypothetical protein N0V82_005353 [Gnomoniopsis sp. IMI 355080]|nr:hypothetical protein N0V82_005353 [Gnomoniopsis sp. IMI 355080]